MLKHSSSTTPYKRLLTLIIVICSTMSTFATASDRGAYWHLAYKPTRETRVIDMPSSLYAVQLLAVSTKQQVERFAEDHDLYDLTAVRIAQNGKPLYVLLPGVYKNREDAQTAVASLPDAVKALNPRIRPLKGLQDAMRRADQTTFAASDDM
ncbi:MAG: SPOR domain-containing protein [Pseudomonadales bacterium]